MTVKDDLEQFAQQPASRRSFLRNTGLVALAGAGAVAFNAGEAEAAKRAPVRGTPVQTVEPMGEDWPEAAAISIRMVRSMTLLAMAYGMRDTTFAATLEQAAREDLSNQIEALAAASRSNSLMYTPNPDDPDPHPWWWWKNWTIFAQREWEVLEVPSAGTVVLDMVRYLSQFNMGFQYRDVKIGSQVQNLALSNIQSLNKQLAQTKTIQAVMWQEGDDLCPKWWRWPFPRPRKTEIITTIPEVGRLLDDMVRSLIGYNTGVRVFDKALGDGSVAQARNQIQGMAGSLGQMSLSRAYFWDPMDDICPRWPPFPWPPHWHHLRDLLDPLAKGDPSPQPNLEMYATFEIFRSIMVFAVASIMDNQDISQQLQDAAVANITTQAKML